jgi:hypothetical protein
MGRFLILFAVLFISSLFLVVGAAEKSVKGRGKVPTWKEIEEAFTKQHSPEFTIQHIVSASVAACTGHAMPVAVNPIKTATALIAHASVDGVMTLLACAVENALFGVPLPEPLARALVYQAAASKSARLLVAALGDNALNHFSFLVKAMPRTGNAPSWTPLHAAVSNNLHILSMAKDALRERLPSGVQGGGESLLSFADSMKRLATALARHSSDKRPLEEAILAFSIRNQTDGGKIISWPITDDGTVEGVAGESDHYNVGDGNSSTISTSPQSLMRTLPLRHPRAIANALSAQLVQIMLQMASRTGAARLTSGTTSIATGTTDSLSPNKPTPTTDTTSIVGKARTLWATVAPAASLALSVDDLGRTPIHIAAAGGATAALSHLLRAVTSAASAEWELGIALHGRNVKGGGAIITSAIEASMSAISLIAFLPDSLGVTPLQSACNRKYWDTVQVLLQLSFPTTTTTPTTISSFEMQQKQQAIDTCLDLASQHAISYSNVTKMSTSAMSDTYNASIVANAAALGWETITNHRHHSSSPSSKSNVINDLLEKSKTNNCQIDTIDFSKLTPEIFLQHYLGSSRPLRIRGLGESGSNIARLFDKDVLMKRAGNVTLLVSDIPYAKSFRVSSGIDDTDDDVKGLITAPRNMSLIEFITNLEKSRGEYIFETPRDAETIFAQYSPRKLLPSFLRRARIPTILAASAAPVVATSADTLCIDLNCLYEIEDGISVKFGAIPGIGWGPVLRRHQHVIDSLLLVGLEPPMRPQFFLGASGTGSPYHVHKDALNILFAGEKQWWIAPPSTSCYSTVPIIEWITTKPTSTADTADTNSSCMPSDAMYQCTQMAGDMLFVPAGWAHAVLNLKTSIGVAVEFPAIPTMGY